MEAAKRNRNPFGEEVKSVRGENLNEENHWKPPKEIKM